MRVYATAALCLAAASMAHCAVRDTAATKDSTVVYNTALCGDTLCALIGHGMEPTLTASLQNGEAVRILLGFTLPADIKKASAITKCQLQMQRPALGAEGEYTLSASQVSGDWDEASVNGMTRLSFGSALGSVDAVGAERPGPIDVTDACMQAVGKDSGRFSLVVDTSGPAVTFPSANTGAAATLRVFT
ncbi:hypothetical protein GGI07_004356 [Coemansia sp. Benny D115]|nr:hypothetical protein GGI07_004356 [Coemansia sp. Benny D115]